MQAVGRNNEEDKFNHLAVTRRIVEIKYQLSTIFNITSSKYIRHLGIYACVRLPSSARSVGTR